MAGCRPLSLSEERNLRASLRKLSPRDRSLVVTQWLTGFRISEVLSLTVGSVLKNGELVSKIGIAPRNMKGGYGNTRWVPVLPSLARALESQLAHLRLRFELTPDLPLFLSRQDNPDGTARSVNRESARQIIRRAFLLAKITDDGRLGTHVLRKTFARNVYNNCGKDLMILKKALNHSSVAITQRYLEVVEDDVLAAISKCDRSRKAKSAAITAPVAAPSPTPSTQKPATRTKPQTPAPILSVELLPVLSHLPPTPTAPAPAPQPVAKNQNAQLDFFIDLAA